MSDNASGQSDDSYTSGDDQRPLKAQKTVNILPVMPDKELGLHDVHVSRLPPEILLTVFDNLNVPNLCRVMLVCAGWRDIAYQSSVWRYANVKLSVNRNSNKLSKGADLLLQSLNRRRIGHIDTSNEAVLHAVAQHMPNLPMLTLWYYTVTEHNLSGNLLSQMTNLTNLHLVMPAHITDHNIELITLHLKKLVQLSLCRCIELTDASLQHIAEGLPKLKDLNVNDCELISDIGMGYLSGRGCRQGAGIPVLDCLNLSNNFSDTLTDQSLLYMSEGQTSLVELDLSYGSLWTDKGMIHLAKMDKLSNVNLQLTNIGSAGLAHLAQGGSKITKLNLAKCLNLTNAGLEHVGRMTHLLDLNLTSCTISDAGLKLLVKFGSKIKKLDLSECPNLSDDAMMHLAKLKDLRELLLVDNRVSDEGYHFLAAAGSQVAILECVMVTDVGLRHLAKLTNLRELSLHRSFITCEGLIDFVDGSVAETMTDLKLVSCYDLDSWTLLFVAQRMFRLELLALDSGHVDDEGKAAAVQHLPRLRQLNVSGKNIIDEVRLHHNNCPQ